MSHSEILDRLIETTKSLRQMTFLGLVIALLVLYLLFERIERLSPQQAQLQTEIRELLETLKAPLELNSYLRENPPITRGYLQFLRPLVALESAAEQAIAAADQNDPRWLSLSPEDRDLARSITDSPQIFLSELELHLDTDLFDLPIDTISDYISWYVWPEREISNENAIQVLIASAKVAKELGQPISEISTPPDSLFFKDYLTSNNEKEALSLLSASRAVPYGDVEHSIGVLNSFCADNDIDYCSTQLIVDKLDSGRFSLIDESEVETIEVSFFPGAISKIAMIKFAPILLLAIVYLQTSHYYRRSTIVKRLVSDSTWDFAKDHSWLMNNTRVFGSLPKVIDRIFTTIMMGLLSICLLLPAISQFTVSLTSIFGFLNFESSWMWAVVHSVCFLLTLLAIMCVLYDEYLLSATKK